LVNNNKKKKNLTIPPLELLKNKLQKRKTQFKKLITSTFATSKLTQLATIESERERIEGQRKHT
jgi:hypothetical protein